MRTNDSKDFSSPPSSLAKVYSEMEQIAGVTDSAWVTDKYKGKKIVITDESDPHFNEKEYEVRYTLRKLYHNKCAYCESITFKPDVEHFRPKGNIRGTKLDNGYYWLCYEWSNLLPACAECNRSPGKNDQFPVLGQRVIQPSFNSGKLDAEKCQANHQELINELPCVLHPEVDEPEIHFVVDKNGYLRAVDGKDSRAGVMIDVCDLNRGNLCYRRKKVIDQTSSRFNDVFDDYRKGGINPDYLPQKIQQIFDEILLNSDVHQEYSFVSFFILRNFDEYIQKNLVELDEV